MPLELRKQKDGVHLRPYWYGRFEVDGKRHCVKLCLIKGAPPPTLSLKDAGDTAFEKSRQKALAELEVRRRQALENQEPEYWVKKLHEMQHGETIKDFPVANLIKAWRRMPRIKPFQELNARYVTDVEATIQRFIDYVATNHPNMKVAAQITYTVADDFIADEEARGISAKTRNDSLIRLRAVFKYLVKKHLVSQNPFDEISFHPENHVHRRPLEKDEIKELLDKVKDDDFIRPLIVCALSTAMRRGDCATLKWQNVHLDEKDRSGRKVLDYVTVKTSKTGDTITAPIDARLREELKLASKKKNDSEFVWPEQAEMLVKNRQGLTWRIQQAFNRAGLDDKARHRKRKHGARRASIVDFHSLRTTWITNKLTEGVPIEVVKRTSGHQSTDVVTEYYFNPGVQQHLKALNAGTIPVEDRDDKLRKIIRKMNAKTLKKDKARLIAILDGEESDSSKVSKKKTSKKAQPKRVPKS